MIHVADQEFEHRVRTGFDEAYLTHTSTSPNYQILASLDAGRRQVELEGYDIVRHSMQLAMTLRERIRSDESLNRYFRVLGPREMIPQQYRPSGLDAYFEPESGWQSLEPAWRKRRVRPRSRRGSPWTSDARDWTATSSSSCS